MSANHDGIDYDALFDRDGDSRKHAGKFVTNTPVGKVRGIINIDLQSSRAM